jgi:hypothetical protein
MDHHNLKRRREDDGFSNDPAAQGVKEHTLFLGALSDKTTEYQLSRLLKPFGPLVRLDILFHKFGPRRGQPRGYGFAELSSRDKASAARDALDGFVLNDKALVVRFVSDKILYEGGMPSETASSTARAGGVIKSGREYRTEAEREADRAAEAMRGATQSVATNKVMAATLEAKLAAIKSRLGLAAIPAATVSRVAGDEPHRGVQPQPISSVDAPVGSAALAHAATSSEGAGSIALASLASAAASRKGAEPVANDT